jgi:hypothetical protein
LPDARRKRKMPAESVKSPKLAASGRLRIATDNKNKNSS